MKCRAVRIAVTFAVLAVLAPRSAPAGDPAVDCQSGKNRAAGKYAACRQKAEAKLALLGDMVGYGDALGTCAAKYAAAWQKLEQKALGACPSTGDADAIDDAITSHTSNVATALAGGPLGNLTLCTGDLATCQAALSGVVGLRLKTGQTDCYDAAGTLVACGGTGQDGELQKGAAHDYLDNGDGTISDLTTGLMWEKLSDDGTLHDRNNQYSWSNAVAVKVAALNSTAFAGYSDWRFPNLNELQSLASYGAVSPAMDPIFQTGCIPNCTVLTCSCTQSSIYWSSTTYLPIKSQAWWINFATGRPDAGGKTIGFYVRAVRGG